MLPRASLHFFFAQISSPGKIGSLSLSRSYEDMSTDLKYKQVWLYSVCCYGFKLYADRPSTLFDLSQSKPRYIYWSII